MDIQADDGLIYAFDLRQGAPAVRVGWEGVTSHRGGVGGMESGTAARWIHLDRHIERAQRWVRESAGLDPLVCDALLAEETRPRATVIGDAAIVILRGVNTNPGTEPEDMTALRCWVEAGRVVSLRLHQNAAVRDVRERVEAGKGPATSGALIADLAAAMISRMSGVMEDLDEEMDGLEEALVAGETQGLRPRLVALRRRAITLRRYVSPLREAVSGLQLAQVSWLSARDRASLRETVDRTTRYVEELDSVRERAQVTQEELSARMSEQMNRTMYILSLVAAVFLPLGLVTGLLGVNVGGIPGTDDPAAFWVLSALLLAVAVGLVVVFRRLRWM